MALADYMYQRARWWNRQKMTVQEVRDEYKQMEGDPAIKGRIRAIRNERSRKRMMANVPNATVIITNPTHYAVALKYDRVMSAPLCLAKGADDVAMRIRDPRQGARRPDHREPATGAGAVRIGRGGRGDPDRTLQGGGRGDRLRDADAGRASGWRN